MRHHALLQFTNGELVLRWSRAGVGYSTKRLGRRLFQPHMVFDLRQQRLDRHAWLRPSARQRSAPPVWPPAGCAGIRGSVRSGRVAAPNATAAIANASTLIQTIIKNISMAALKALRFQSQLV